MKARQFQFFLGMHEEQSTASLLMGHDTGFATVQEAMESLAKTILSKPKPKQQAGVICTHCKKFVVTDEAPEIFAGDIFRTFFHGDVTSTVGGIDLYQELSDAGWLLDGERDRKTPVQVFRTDEVLNEILTGELVFDLEVYIVAPKGIKIYNK